MCVLRFFNRVLPAALALQLMACGGSGGSGAISTPPPPVTSQPTAQDLANAKAAAMGATLNLSTGLATLSWSDTFPNASGYSVQEQTDASTWTTVDTIPGHGGNQQPLTWSRAVNATETLRVQAVEIGYDVPLLTTSGQQHVQITFPTRTPTIVLNQTEPLSGQVQISVSNASASSSVSYFVDLLTLSTSTAAPDFSVNWETTSITSGPHLIVAQLQVSPDFNLQVRRSVQVSNSEVAISVNPSAGMISSGATLFVVATSDAGIRSVTLSMDGNPVGTLIAPNAGGNTYGFQVTGTSGAHAFNAKAIDNNGQSATASVTLKINNPPQISLSSPVDGGLTNGTLQIAGTVTSDKSGTVSTSATLGNLPVLSATTARFSTSFSLTGVVPGDYTLTVVATDSTGSTTSRALIVTVTSSPNLVFSPLQAIGATGDLLATDPSTVLFRAADQSVHLLASSSDITLAPTATADNFSQWALSSGNAFALTPVSGQMDLIYWNAGGTSTDLGSLGPINTDYLANLLTVHWPWALTIYWTVPSGAVTGDAILKFYNAQNGQMLTPFLPEVSAVAGSDDFFASPTGLTLYYMTDLSSNPGFNPIGVDSWVQNSNQITPLATGSLWQTDPQTDGTRVAWRSGAVGGGPGPSSLIATDIASSSQSTLSTTMSKFKLADGILAWAENGSNTTMIKASDGTTVTTISALTSSVLYGTGGGYVLFGEDSKLYVWSSAAGKQVILDAVPDTAAISGKTVYFTNGIQQLLYSVTLN